MSAKSSWSASFRQFFSRASLLVQPTESLSPEALFQRRLERYLPFSVQLRFNENRSTLLSVQGRRFSVHRLFLEAPEEVIRELARYVMGRRTRPVLRRFIQTARYESNREIELEPKGAVYDLSQMMEELNAYYFEGELDLKIGWFGREMEKRRHITFGQYMADLKAIKIHRMLDDTFYPRFFVAFVVYHEMLHAVIPGYHDERGHFRVHGPEFKKREKQFHAYARARRWEKANREKIFGWA